jgi:prealbumin domain-containing protein
MLVILIAPVTDTDFFSLPNPGNLIDNLIRASYSQQEQEMEEQTIIDTTSAQNKSSSFAAVNNTIQGTLIVTTKVNNQGGGSSQPSDFTIKVHGNNPSTSSFPGNACGTVVKLGMGMYSITESGPSDYHSTSSMDCSGAVMSVDTIKCEITNTYIEDLLVINNNNINQQGNR